MATGSSRISWSRGSVDRAGLHQQAQGGPRDHQSDGAACAGKQDALGVEVAPETEARGPERPADGDLALAQFGADQEEVGDIRARDQEHHTYRREQDPQPSCDAAERGVLERAAGERQLGVDVGSRFGIVGIGLRDPGEQPL